jgi:hypothetical protein
MIPAFQNKIPPQHINRRGALTGLRDRRRLTDRPAMKHRLRAALRTYPPTFQLESDAFLVNGSFANRSPVSSLIFSAVASGYAS